MPDVIPNVIPKPAHRAFALLMVLAVLGFSSAAWSHAALVKSVPGSREELAQSPTHIRLQFNEKIEAKFSTVALEDAAGNKLELDVPAAAPDSEFQLDVGIPKPLDAGRYTVRYRALSQDGHVIEKSYAFTVKPARATP